MVDTVKILGALLGGGGVSQGSGANILKSVLGAAMKGGSQSSGGGLSDLLGGVLAGQQQQSGGSNPMSDILGSVLGGGNQSSGGGLGSVLGGMLGGGQKSAPQGGGLEDLLGGVLGGNQGGGADLGSLIGAALNQFGQAQKSAQDGSQVPSFEEHSPGIAHNEACDQATLMIRAMVNAAKSDGRVDESEQQNIIGKLGHVTQDEIDFVNNELRQPLDVAGFARSVPSGMANQVYAMSLMGIDLDTNQEAKYLHELAQNLRIDPQTANQIHQQLGAPVLYS
ncbi:MAG: DUF533 domain-containing protein [Pseudomonadota bacterium]